MADEQHVEVGEVVRLDDIEVLQREERRTVRTGGKKERGIGRELGRSELAAEGRDKPALDPFMDRQGDRRFSHRAVDGLRRAHLEAPRQAALPALVDQLPGGRGERIGHRIPDVAASVTVEIDPIACRNRRE